MQATIKQLFIQDTQFQIIEFNNPAHREQVINLWQLVFGYKAAHNAPDVVIDKKLENKDQLFFVACQEQEVVVGY